MTSESVSYKNQLVDESGAVNDSEIDDALGPEDEIIPFEYTITSYGADYPTEMLVNRLRDGDIFIPPFQRGYVWNQKVASRFIESLLLGLPVPGIFLSKENKTQKHLVIDGQQRLRTLQYFFDGIFEPSDRPFRLESVQTRFKNLTYKTLEDGDRRRLNDAIVHSTIVRQDDPTEDESSIYHIFERLNSGGKQLAPQEIRRSLFHGPIVQLLDELNQNPAWRAIYGPSSPVLRDQELVLRFLAFRFFAHSYHAPMKVFLNRYMGRNRDLQSQSAQDAREAFIPAIELIYQALGERSFHPQKALNAAVFDSILVGLSERLARGPITDVEAVRDSYNTILADPEFIKGSARATANEQRVRERFTAAMTGFELLP